MGKRYTLGPGIKGQYVPQGNPVQGDYFRGAHAYQTSDELKSFQSCIRKQLQGKDFNSIKAVNEALTDAAHSCE